jgi:acyl-CoA synthetase (AMP-forming)/AMP-acid ligase II
MSNWQTESFWLSQFSEFGPQTALVWRSEEWSYDYLREAVINWHAKMENIPSGSVVGLESDFTPQTVAILFALIEKKCIIAPFDIHHSVKNQKKFDIAQLDYLLEVKSETEVITTKRAQKDEKHAFYDVIQELEHPGLVLFTSGSSGEPKGALHDLSKLLAKFTIRRKALRTINFLLFDHWGGLNTLFHILSNGGCVVTLENRTPDYVCEMIQNHLVELLPTSPTFLNLMLLSRAYERYNLGSLNVITYGAEPMPESLLKSLVKSFPDIQFQQTYGLIELGVMRSKSENNDSLWVKIGGEGYDFRVVDGLLQVKADSAMLGYLNAPSPFTEDGWFMTGDLVEVKGEYFRILGRKSELINVGGEKVYPQEVENVILAFSGISDVVVFAEKNPIAGNIVCANIKLNEAPEDPKKFIKQLKTYCRTQLQPFKIPVKVFIVDDIAHSERFKKKRV